MTTRLTRLRAFEILHKGRRTPPVTLTTPAKQKRSDRSTTHSQIGGTDGSFKVELIHYARCTTRDEAKASIFESIEMNYNRVRRHSTLEYRTPDEFVRTHKLDIRSLAVHFPWGRSVSPLPPTWPRVFRLPDLRPRGGPHHLLRLRP